MFREYDFMCCNTKVGTFYVDEDVPKRKFKISLNPKYIHSRHMILMNTLQVNYELDDEMVRHFMKRRVVPKYRDNIDEILRDLGMSEYDPYLIAKHNRVATMHDRLWVNYFNERMQDFHPKADLLLNSLDSIIEEDAMF